MKRSLSVALLATLVVSACIPSFAQRAKAEATDRAVKPVRTSFGKVEAYTDGNGVLVRWNMSVERQNVGFNVYRIGNGEAERINPLLILGSSARAGDEVTYGDTYQFFDPSGEPGSQYFVTNTSRDGRNYSSKVTIAELVKDLFAVTGLSSDEWLAAANSPNRNPESGKMELHPELAQIVNESLQVPDPVNHRWVVSQPGVKISVRKEGLYRVSSGELTLAGFDTTGDSTKWRLFAEGVEQAIIVGAGNAYIEFYGKPIDTVESDTRVYYLITGAVDGKRMATKVMRPVAGNSTSSTYLTTAVRKERFSYVNQLHNGDLENYWGRVVTSSPTTLPFSLTGVPSTGTVDLQIRMQGYSQGTHLLRLILNGQEIQSQTWNAYDAFTGTLTIPANLLAEGTNNLEMTGMNPGDFSLFDSISVKFNRRYLAEQNRIAFFTPGYRKVDVTGFTSANVRMFDITHDGSPIEIIGFPVQQDGATFTAKLPSHRNIVGYGVDQSAVMTSPSVVKNFPSNYSSSIESYEFVIISHSAPDFLAAAETWANYRRNQGYSAIVIDVADIFDEFNYGSLSADAIRAFLSYTNTSWRAAPGYVLLMGDATYDPRNYEGFGYWDLVPTKNVSLIYEESGSDEALADFNNDGLSEIAIGRIPARNVTAINTAFNKTQLFETAPMQSLDRGAIFAYDLPNGFDFAGMSLQLRNELPQSMPAVMVDRGAPDSGTTLLNEMNTGRYIANYSGHGSTGLWAASSFFGNNSVPFLTNANNPTLYTMLTCLNGYFLAPSSSVDSLAENLLKSANGGGAATWASSARTTPDIQLLMGLRFFNKLGEGSIPRLGDLIKDAKTAIPSGADVRYSWVLLGDPMLKVR